MVQCLRSGLLLAVVALPAAAQQSGLDNNVRGDRPWASGVSAANQKAALDLFREGNVALKDSLYVKAAQTYRDALKAWDHPAIHYNLALALVNLDQPLETLEHLEAALKFGAAPLDSDKFDQALRYKTLIEKQLAGVDIRCNMEGATVKLDGTVLYTAPGRYVGKVRAGPHSIVATKEGYITNELSMPLPAGQTKVFELNLMTTDDLTEYKRLWPTQVPWVVLASGVAVAGVGVGLHFAAKGAYQDYDAQVTKCSVETPSAGGCTLTPELAAQRQKGDVLQGLAIGAYAVGGAAIATSLVLFYANRLQPYRISVGVTNGSAMLVPTIGPHGAGATLLAEF